MKRQLPALALVLGAAMLAVSVPLGLAHGPAVKELPWLLGTATFVACAAVVLRRLPEHPVARWFAVTAAVVPAVQLLDLLALRYVGATQADAAAYAWVLFGYQMGTIFAVVAVARLLGLFPDGKVERRYEQVLLRGLWWLLALPPLVFVGRPTLLAPSYHVAPEVANPYHLLALSALGEAAGVGVTLAQGLFVTGVGLLALRYRRAGAERRRQVRWLLLPGFLAAAVAVIDAIAWRAFPVGAPTVAAEITLTVLWVLTLSSLPIALAIALLRPDVLDVDRVIRKSLVYGLLWALIAVAYVGAAAGLGLAAGRRLPVGLAIALAVGATLVFQPARQRLERLADRWVFGVRADPARLVARLGAALEETVELERLLPRMAETLREGLGLQWARVRLEPAPPVGDDEPALTVPITLGEERLGVVECGPKRTGDLTGDDRAVVNSFARQAALAVRNLRLAAELEQSRVRLVRAQEVERRRLERNIHDGIQQDLVALMGQAGRLRSQLRRGRDVGDEALTEIQDRLRQVIADLRELTHGIHPSVLSDRGLLEAVEALASRSGVPVSVRADPALRDRRFAEEVEGAGYFTIAESLANVGKHAQATRAQVSIATSDGVLLIEVLDDGRGFDPAIVNGGGLGNMAERLAALGGRLEVVSRPGEGTSVTARLKVVDA